MANIIRLGGGGGSQPTLITKSITANGTYNASSDNADGYSSVNVNVSGGSSYVDISTFAHYFKRNTTTPTITKISDYEYSLSFTDQSAAGYELCSFSVSLSNGIYIAEIKATVSTNTGLSSSYLWGIYSSYTENGAKVSDAGPKNGYATYVPFDRTDTAEHTYQIPIFVRTGGVGYICFGMSDDNNQNATVTVSSLKIRTT